MVYPLRTSAGAAAGGVSEASGRTQELPHTADGAGGRRGYLVGRRGTALGTSPPHTRHEKGALGSSLHMTESGASAGSQVRVLYSAAQIHERVREMGLGLARDYQGLNPILVGVLKGASAFHVDLARATPIELELDFVSVSSYASGTAPGRVRLLTDLRSDIRDRHVILCEGVVDSGQTLSMLIDLLRPRGPASLEVATLLDKKPCRQVDVPLRYIGWTAGADFLVGYGLDIAERYRNLPYV